VQADEFTISVAIHVINSDANGNRQQPSGRPQLALALQQIVQVTLVRECDVVHKLERALLDSGWGDPKVQIEISSRARP
jgi:hypothetical protein